MKKNEVAALYSMQISELKRKLEQLERQKQQFVTEVYHIRTHPKLAPKKREVLLARYLRGKSYEGWLEYYDDHLDARKGEIFEHEKSLHEYNVPEQKPYFAIAAVLVILGIVAFGMLSWNGGVTSLTVANPTPQPTATEKAIEINVSPINVTELRELEANERKR
ncbi:MAG: hypothetical protein AABX51_04130 [Nanoarchaeota archaeon]